MELLAVVLILIVWAIIAIKKALEPTIPPIDDIFKHCKIIHQLPNQKARQKYLKNLSKKHK